MWILESAAHPENNTHSILGDHRYVVGRQNCDIVVTDPSVSRRQAVLTMAHYETNVAKSFVIPTLTLEDVSKFGTFVNGKAVKTAGGNTVTLKENDQIKFGGTPASLYRARYQPFLATTSCLEKGPKKALQRVMCLLGGHLVRDWRPTCDLLIMSKINVTLKVICAINNQKHIVTPKYLDDLHQHLMSGADKPDPKQYLPEVVDQEVPQGVSFHPDKRRQTLLEGLKFYFLSPLQFNKTNLAVSTAGGQPILLEDGSDEDAEAMTQEGTVVVLVTKDVMETLSPASAKFVRTVVATLKKKNLRMITDPEIGTAILTCNMVDYCNPKAALAPNLQAAMASQIMSQMADIDSTQVSCVTAVPKSRDIKPEIRSMPAPSEANLAHSSRKIGIHEDIKPEEISHSGNNGSGKSGRNLMEQHCEPCPVGLTRLDITKPTPASAKLFTSDLKRSVPEAASSGNESNSSGTFKIADRAKEGNSSKPDKALPSQSFSDLFGDGNSVSESLPSSTGKKWGYQTLLHADECKDFIPSVFVRQRMKKRGNCVVSGTDDDNDIGVSKSSSKLKKMMSLFDDEEEDSNKTKIGDRKHSGASKRKFLFDDDSEEDISDSSALKRNCKSDVSFKSGQETSSCAATDTKPNDLDQESILCSPAERNGDSDLTNIDSKGMAISDKDPALEVFETRTESSASETKFVDCGKTYVLPGAHAAQSKVGWVSAASKKIKIKSKVEDESGLFGQDNDVKPDVELIRDATGKILRNLCEVELTELVVRQPDSRSKLCQDSNDKTGNQKNFKRFKKTEHAGAGKLPTIIGGRDLEEHRGTVHKDLEDLFTKGVARQNERDEEERQNRDLFDWDAKNRKTANRRIR